MMAVEFRYALIVIGVLLMAGLVIHGLWSSRKANQEAQHRFYPDENKNKETAEGFDEFGVGRPRKLAPGEKPQPKPAPTVAPRAGSLREPVRNFKKPQTERRDEPSLSFSA